MAPPQLSAIEADFLKQLAETPGDRTLRDIYADWLEEQGAPELAAVWRSEREIDREQVTDDVSLARTEPQRTRARLHALLSESGGDVIGRDRISGLFEGTQLGAPENVVWIRFGRADVVARALPLLAECPSVRDVSLANQTLTPAVWDWLESLDELTHLSLKSCRLEQSDFERLLEFVELKSLSLDDTNVEDGDLPLLTSCVELTTLSLYYTAVTEAGVRELIGLLPNLRHVNARRTLINRDGRAKKSTFRAGQTNVAHD